MKTSRLVSLSVFFSSRLSADWKERKPYIRHAQKATGSHFRRIQACAIKPESHDSWDKNSIIPESLLATTPLTKEPEDSGYEIGHAPGSWLADFDPFACFCFWMTVTIMIDGSVKRNRKFACYWKALWSSRQEVDYCIGSSSIAVETSRSTSQSDSIVRQTNKRSFPRLL